jgi:hypothetical protein
MLSNSRVSRPIQPTHCSEYAVNCGKSDRLLSSSRECISISQATIVNARPYAINPLQTLSTRMEQSRTLIYVRTAAQRPPSSPEGSGCVFVHGKKFPVRSGRGRRKIHNGGMVAWLNHQASGQAQLEVAQTMDLLHRTELESE